MMRNHGGATLEAGMLLVAGHLGGTWELPGKHLAGIWEWKLPGGRIWKGPNLPGLRVAGEDFLQNRAADGTNHPQSTALNKVLALATDPSAPILG